MGALSKRKCFLVTAAVCLAAVLCIIIAVSVLEYGAYTKTYNEKIGAVGRMIRTQYPEISDLEIMKILNSDETGGKDFFSSYGIDPDRDSAIRENDRIFRVYLVRKVVLVLLGGMALVGILLFGAGKRGKEAERISGYLENINRGDYSFHMEDSSEGELSGLESEIYKTTIMLKEAADHSRQDKERLKDSLSDISHQLKTPLTSLVINLENLEDHPDIDIEARNRLIGNAKRDANRIRQMVQQLLTLSKLDANVIAFKKEKVSLAEIVKEAMENVAALAELRDIRVETSAGETPEEFMGELPEISAGKSMETSADKHTGKSLEAAADALPCGSLETYITGDSYWEKQAITNILKNAVEHARSVVTVGCSNCGLYREIVIENDGDPISERDRKNIFKRFYSGENPAKDSLGIGLSLANAIVKNDGGYITVESDETTRFIVRYW